MNFKGIVGRYSISEQKIRDSPHHIFPLSMREYVFSVKTPERSDVSIRVFNMDHLAFDGDMPVGIKYMHLLANRYKEMRTKGQIIGFQFF